MDGLEDTVGKLSLTAKEWRPGQGFASPEPETTRQISAESTGWNGEERLDSQSSWGGEC